MASVNKVIIVGRLGQDPDLRYAPKTERPVANFSIATSEFWNDKSSGQKNERTEWHRVVVWGRVAELCKESLRKGSQVFVEGRLQTRDWMDRDGNKRYTTEVIANNVQFLDPKNTVRSEDTSAKNEYNQEPAYEPINAASKSSSHEEIFNTDDDVPF